jgi:hypothetical protein
MRRRSALAALVLGVGCVGYALFASPSDDEQIRTVLGELATALSYDDPPNPVHRTANLNGAFRDIFTEDVQIHIAELSAKHSGRARLGQLGARASMGYQTLDLDFGDISVELEEGAANVSLTAEMHAARGSEAKRDVRRAQLVFAKVDGDWRIARVRVRAPAAEQ